jgi:hypothetical protein
MLQSAGKKKRVGKVQFAEEDDTVIPPSSSLEDNDSSHNTSNFFSPNLGEQGSIRFRSREDRTRTAREAGIATGGTVSNPDYADTLRRVSVVVQQHILRGERLKRKYNQKLAEQRAANLGPGHTMESQYQRSPEMTVSFSSEGPVDLTGDRKLTLPKPAVQMSRGETKTTISNTNTGRGPSEPRISLAASLPVSERLAASSSFHEDLFVKPTWKYTFVRASASGLFLTNYRMDKVKKKYAAPEVSEIHAFINNLFIKGQVRQRESLLTFGLRLPIYFKTETKTKQTWTTMLFVSASMCLQFSLFFCSLLQQLTERALSITFSPFFLCVSCLYLSWIYVAERRVQCCLFDLCGTVDGKCRH